MKLCLPQCGLGITRKRCKNFDSGMSVYIYMSELFLYNWGYVLIYVKILKNAQNAAQEIFKIKASDSHFFLYFIDNPPFLWWIQCCKATDSNSWPLLWK